MAIINQPMNVEGSAFRDFIRSAAKEVNGWPEWKRVYSLNHGRQGTLEQQESDTHHEHKP